MATTPTNENNNSPSKLKRFMSMFELSESAANFIYNSANVLVVIAAVIGGIGAIGLYWGGGWRDLYNERRTLAHEQRTGEANRAAAQANEGLAKANLDIEDRQRENLQLSLKLESERMERLALEKAIAPRANLITEEQLNAFAAALERIPDKASMEAYALDDAEPLTLAELRILPVLEHVSWPITKKQKTGIWFPTLVGTQIQVASLPAPSCCEELRDAFRLLGLDDVQIIVAGERKPAEGTFWLYIGSRPIAYLPSAKPHK
jgi:hypothetical protein